MSENIDTPNPRAPMRVLYVNPDELPDKLAAADRAAIVACFPSREVTVIARSDEAARNVLDETTRLVMLGRDCDLIVARAEFDGKFSTKVGAALYSLRNSWRKGVLEIGLFPLEGRDINLKTMTPKETKRANITAATKLAAAASVG